MTLEKRIEAFSELGTHLRNLDTEQLDELYWKAGNGNSWFTPENVKRAIDGICIFLDQKTLEQWVSQYQLAQKPQIIGTVMAGNIPLVGFHDLLCVLISGHHLMIKMSSQDSFLMTYMIDTLSQINPAFRDRIIQVDRLKGMDAIIATGSDNTARYFEYYFGKYPNIIRKNRSSCAILNGNEEKEELAALGEDIFTYFGLGCRNVSKLYVPKGYDHTSFFEAIETSSSVKDHHKYNNNYDYNKSIYLINGEKHLDNGFLLVKQSNQLVSPISVLYFEEYNGLSELDQKISHQSEKIQCIVSAKGWYANSLDFRQAQSPAINDYADHVDTMWFLSHFS